MLNPIFTKDRQLWHNLEIKKTPIIKISGLFWLLNKA